MDAIVVDQLAKQYGRIRALSGVSFRVAKGEVIGLLGPNGAGKTTLMKLLTGFLEPDEGTLSIHGVDVIADPIGAQGRIGYLPESAPLYSEMLVQEYLATIAALRGIPFGDRRDRIAEAAHATGLVPRLVQPIATLSKGYRQRVGIAQALMHRPDVLILDEPTTGLDPTQIVEIRELIQRLAKDTTILLSTHILSEVEATCERVLVIMGGQLRADADVAELRSANAAIVAIEQGAQGVEAALRDIAGVTGVTRLGDDGGFIRWRVEAADDAELCPTIFAALRTRTWRVGELRADPKTLESVFKDLAASPHASVRGRGKAGTS